MLVGFGGSCGFDLLHSRRTEDTGLVAGLDERVALTVGG